MQLIPMSHRENCDDGLRGLLLDVPLDQMISIPALAGSKRRLPDRRNAVRYPGGLANLTLPVGSSDPMNSSKVRARALALLRSNRRATRRTRAIRFVYH